MKRYVVFLVLLSFSVLLAACGGGGSNASTSINVTMTDFQFVPNAFTVPAGKAITFTATNNGGVEHSFVIMKLGHELTSGFTDADQPNVYWKKTAIPVGQTVTDTFTAPSEPGTYQIVCAVSGHFEAGMIAKLVVVAGE
jgi:plastocyanin